jgi:hypothetical protein
MSGHASSDDRMNRQRAEHVVASTAEARDAREVRDAGDARVIRFARWPGRMSLVFGLLAGPLVVLLNQVTIYASNMWVCGKGMSWSLHIIPVISLIIALGAAYTAHRDWTDLGRGIRDKEATIAERSRFLALLGIGASAISALLILAMWLSIIVFGPCMRA